MRPIFESLWAPLTVGIKRLLWICDLDLNHFDPELALSVSIENIFTKENLSWLVITEFQVFCVKDLHAT